MAGLTLAVRQVFNIQPPRFVGGARCGIKGSDLVGPVPEGMFPRFRLLLSGIVTQGIHDAFSPLGTDD